LYSLDDGFDCCELIENGHYDGEFHGEHFTGEWVWAQQAICLKVAG
jgi:hypothetical protein